MDQEFTLGIEEEFQIVDPNTRELRSRVAGLDEGLTLLGGATQAGDAPVHG